MKLGTLVRLDPGHIVLDGNPAPLPQRVTAPIFGPYLLRPNGCVDQDATWYGCIGLGIRDIVLDGTSSPSTKGAQPRNFRPMSVVAKRLDELKCHLVQATVFDGDPATPEKKAHPPHPIFGRCLLWPNGWMDEDATWYGSRPRPSAHCIRRGPSSSQKGHSSPPPLSAHVYCGHGRPSQLLLSSCYTVFSL